MSLYPNPFIGPGECRGGNGYCATHEQPVLACENERLLAENVVATKRAEQAEAALRAEVESFRMAVSTRCDERNAAEAYGREQAKRACEAEARTRALEAALVTLMVAPTNRENADTSREYNSAWAAASDVLGRNPFEYRAALTEPPPPQEKKGELNEAKEEVRRQVEVRVLDQGRHHVDLQETSSQIVPESLCSCGESLRELEADLARVRGALRHAIYRNHECTDACSACVEAEAALEGR